MCMQVELDKQRKLAAAEAAARAAAREADVLQLQMEKMAAGGEELRSQLEELRRQNGEVTRSSELTAEELRRELEERRKENAELQGKTWPSARPQP